MVAFFVGINCKVGNLCNLKLIKTISSLSIYINKNSPK